MTKVLADTGLLQRTRGDGPVDLAAAQPAVDRHAGQAQSAAATEDLTAPIFYIRSTGVDVWPSWLRFGRRSRD